MKARLLTNRLYFILPPSSSTLPVEVAGRRVHAQRAELLEHGHEVEVVPSLDYLAVGDADDGDAREIDRAVCGGKAQSVAAVAAAHYAARRDLVALRDGVLHDDLYLGERLAEAAEEWLEARGPAQLTIRHVRKPVRHTLLAEQLVNRLLAPLVPDLLEPAADERR